MKINDLVKYNLNVGVDITRTRRASLVSYYKTEDLRLKYEGGRFEVKDKKVEP